eukprot:6197866-Pleurochrysis_carterae.AAC.2
MRDNADAYLSLACAVGRTLRARCPRVCERAAHSRSCGQVQMPACVFAFACACDMKVCVWFQLAMCVRASSRTAWGRIRTLVFECECGCWCACIRQSACISELSVCVCMCLDAWLLVCLSKYLPKCVYGF